MTARGCMDVTAFRTVAKNDPDWIIRSSVHDGLAEALKGAGLPAAGHENNAVLLLLSVDGEASDVILTESPRWKTRADTRPTSLFNQLLDASNALNQAIAAMEAGQ